MKLSIVASRSDNSWDYNEGRSEIRMGNALCQSGYRDKVFLMTKIDEGTKEAAMRRSGKDLSSAG
jgi:uncharacterized protein